MGAEVQGVAEEEKEFFKSERTPFSPQNLTMNGFSRMIRGEYNQMTWSGIKSSPKAKYFTFFNRRDIVNDETNSRMRDVIPKEMIGIILLELELLEDHRVD
ncbi:hypothetical protein HAX54_044288 [Datura stramonium]|uniref:Uncharacterized protein n=1 Tax=Datura stramonium TaxID=4076 RepID=A0ABS8W5Y5_DATST|nr:hypothetical protein [Datura stramonium]